MNFREFFFDSIKDKVGVQPKEYQNSIFIINPPMKLMGDDGSIDTITTPTMFKILKVGTNFITIQDISYGNFPYDKKSDKAGKTYVIKGSSIDNFLAPPSGQVDISNKNSSLPGIIK